MAMPGEYEFYAARSGLPADHSLGEHKRAYFIAEAPAPATATLVEAAYAFYLAKTGLSRATATYTDACHLYYSTQTGLVGAVADLMAAFFRNPPPVGPTEQRRNLFLNPAGAGAKAWEWFGSAVTADGVQAAAGPVANARWQKYTLTGAVAGTAETLQLAPTGGVGGMPVLGGTTYIFSAYGLISAGTAGTAGLYMLEEYDAAGVLVGAPNLAIPAAPAAGAWGRHSRVLTTDPATRFVVPNYRFTAVNMAAGTHLGVGAVLAELGAVLGGYFDGSFPDGGGNDYQWVATADDSASILLA